MKIAITADNHLTTAARHPQRFQALEDIYQQCGEFGVQLLIIAGDLFDQSLANYSDFEKLHRAARPAGMTTLIIPGNHDPQLDQRALAGEGLQVHAEPTLLPLNDSRQLLLLPYRDQQSMGEGIAPFADRLAGRRWILVSHGDWSAGTKPPDPYERGVYMPLTSPDLERYQPELVFLGHIHLPQSQGRVYYPGSPCPLDITETGPRRFLILDTQRGEVSSQPVNSSPLYFDERFLVIPGENELQQLKSDLQNRIADWDLPEGWEDRVQVRVTIYGSSSTSRDEILELVESSFQPYAFYQGQPPSLDDLIFSLDEDRAEIASQVRRWVENQDWEAGPKSPPKSDILQAALRLIYQA